MSSDPRQARRRAQEYQEQSSGDRPPEPGQKSPPRSEAEWRDHVSEAIEAAMRQGEFDNLRGRGKPLDLARDPFVPEGSELAWEIMRNNQVVPAWQGARVEVLAEIDRWRSRLRAALDRPAQHPALRAELEPLNRRIRDVNLQQPVVTMEIFHLRWEEELRRAAQPPPP